MNSPETMRVAVAMSGGVDSSVAALLMKEAGYEVAGIMMAIWDKSTDDTLTVTRDACFGPGETEDIANAQKVCDTLGIHLHVFDCVNEYRDTVLAYFRSEYAAARTPNPCVKCNQMMKFGFLPHLARESGLVFDRFVTGHYVNTGYNRTTGRYHLVRAVDSRRDQSYFLYRLSQEQIASTIFPLGSMTKDEIRVIAQGKGLPVADKPDSQDFYCGDYNELLNFERQPGDIVDRTGTKLGTHEGLWRYTVGQRRGLGIAHPEPLYVIGMEPETNRLVVGPDSELLCETMVVGDMHWGMIAGIAEPRTTTVKIRSSSEPVGVTVEPQDDERLQVRFDEPQRAVTPGQSAVFYDGDMLLCGGVIV